MDNWFTVRPSNFCTKVANINTRVDTFNKVSGKVLDTELQHSLILEELEELKDAIAKRDKVNTLEELCDLLIVSGYMLAGASTNADWLMDFDIQRGVCFDHALDDVYSSFPTTLAAEALGACMEMLYSIDADWYSAAKAICDSNMSKFSHYCPTCLEDYDRHALSLMKDGRYKGVSWKLDNSYVIWTDQNGKILKGLDYVKADVSCFVYKRECEV